MIDLASEYRLEIKQIIQEHTPECEIRAFGSRVSGKARDYSDLDFALVSSKKNPSRTLSDIKDAFAESNLPFRVDVHDWNALSSRFQETLNEQYEVL